MRFLRSPIPYLFLICSSTLAYGQSDNRLNEPRLGPIILIAVDSSEPDGPRLLPGEPRLGPIIPIAAFSELDSADELPPVPPNEYEDARLLPAYGAVPIPMLARVAARVIQQPIPAPIGEPFAFNVPPIPGPVHPDEIQAHLSAAAAQLALAGLPAEAQKIQQFQQQLDRDHSQQLLIAFKQAQIRELQAEIEFLKRTQQPVAKDVPVYLQMKVIELNLVARGAVLSKLNGGAGFTTENVIGPVIGSCDPQWIGDLVESLCKNGDAKIFAEPRCTILSGRSVRLLPLPGGRSPIITTIGEESTAEASAFEAESSICATPHVLDRGLIQLKLTGKYTYLASNIDELIELSGFHNRSASVPCRHSDQIEANVQMTSGQTLIIMGKGHDKTLLLLVTPEIADSSQTIQKALTIFGNQAFEPATTTYKSFRCGNPD